MQTSDHSLIDGCDKLEEVCRTLADLYRLHQMDEVSGRSTSVEINPVPDKVPSRLQKTRRQRKLSPAVNIGLINDSHPENAALDGANPKLDAIPWNPSWPHENQGASRMDLFQGNRYPERTEGRNSRSITKSAHDILVKSKRPLTVEEICKQAFEFIYDFDDKRDIPESHFSKKLGVDKISPECEQKRKDNSGSQSNFDKRKQRIKTQQFGNYSTHPQFEKNVDGEYMSVHEHKNLSRKSRQAMPPKIDLQEKRYDTQMLSTKHNRNKRHKQKHTSTDDAGKHRKFGSSRPKKRKALKCSLPSSARKCLVDFHCDTRELENSQSSLNVHQ